MEAGLMTPIDPPLGLLYKMAEEIVGGKERAALLAVHNPGELLNALRAARAVWDAVAEGLGLSEDHITTGGSPTGPVLPPSRTFRRLVSKWEPQP
jgi:hypothetical protein